LKYQQRKKDPIRLVATNEEEVSGLKQSGDLSLACRYVTFELSVYKACASPFSATWLPYFFVYRPLL
jgi:hypothetical protein